MKFEFSKTDCTVCGGQSSDIKRGGEKVVHAKGKLSTAVVQ